jgi:hypothetical protein
MIMGGDAGKRGDPDTSPTSLHLDENKGHKLNYKQQTDITCCL